MSSVINQMESRLASLTLVIATQTNSDAFSNEDLTIDLLRASISLVSAQQVFSTATGDIASSASKMIVHASSLLSSLTIANSPYGMIPSFPANLAITIIMSALLATHAFLGIFFQTWWFGITTSLCLILEVIGYIGRTLSANGHVLDHDFFIIQITTLTIAPAFVMAGIYYLLSQLIHVYGAQYSLIKPRLYTWVFISADVLSLIIQAAGGGIAASSDTRQVMGTHILVAGIAIQLIGMSVFMGLFAYYFYTIGYMQRSKFHQNESSGKFEQEFQHLRKRKRFAYWPIAIFAGVVFIFIRSLYRVVELAEGWSGYLITHETYFLVLDAVMITIALLIFVLCHPGIMMGRINPLKSRAENIEVEVIEELSTKSETDLATLVEANSEETESGVFPAATYRNIPV